MKKFNKIIAALFLFFLYSTVVFADYAIIVDAGSSGSRLHLFQYKKTANVPKITDIFSVNVKPGLSAYASNPHDAGNSLKKLFDDAMQQLQQNHVDPHSVSVSVLATAGMRLLPRDQQEAIYANIKQFIAANYPFTIADIKTISGKMEGVYGWLDVNYLKQTFQTKQPTFGIIDMGGASTEIAFAVTSAYSPLYILDIHVGGKEYFLFSKSFLRLGQDQAREQIKKMTPSASSCFPSGYHDSDITGHFNQRICGQLYDQLIQDHSVALYLGTVPHDPTQPFIAYSGIFYNYDFFGATSNPTRANLATKIATICSKTWTQLQQEYPSITPAYLSTYCANGVYMQNLIYDTYLLDGSQLTVTNKIGQQDIDWTLGALLYRLVT